MSDSQRLVIVAATLSAYGRLPRNATYEPSESNCPLGTAPLIGIQRRTGRNLEVVSESALPIQTTTLNSRFRIISRLGGGDLKLLVSISQISSTTKTLRTLEVLVPVRNNISFAG